MNKTSSVKRKGGAGWVSDWNDMHPDAGAQTEEILMADNYGFEIGNTADAGFCAGREAFRSGLNIQETRKIYKCKSTVFRNGLAKGWKWQKARSLSAR
jgi:hypothetical protein